MVQVRHSQHEIGADGADLCAISHHADMRRFRVLAAHLQTVLDCLQADLVTFGAVGDALLHLGTHGSALGHAEVSRKCAGYPSMPQPGMVIFDSGQNP
jgi:hypothetical protein